MSRAGHCAIRFPVLWRPMIVDSIITLNTGELSEEEWRKLLSSLTFFDSEQREVMVYHYKATKGQTTLPRGAWAIIPDKEYDISDLRARPSMPALDFIVDLDTHGQEGQAEAVQAMFREEQGVIVRPPGSGKTQILLSFIAACETRSLVIVPTLDIMQQWMTYAERAILDIDIGTIQGQSYKIGHLTLATPNTLKKFVNKGRAFWKQFGCLIIDEVQHGAAQTYEWIVNACPAYYRFGASAAVQRADEMQPLVFFLMGPVIHYQPVRSKVPVVVSPIKTGFRFRYRGWYDWMPLLDAITKDERRNRIIANIADREVSAGHSVLVLSRRVEQIVRIQEMMTTRRNALLIGSAPQDEYSKGRVKKPNKLERERIIKNFRRGKIKCLLSTQLADEALDVPILDRVILSFPGKASGRIVQQVGRAIRQHPDKESAIIYDCVDVGIGILEKQFKERCRAYDSMAIKVKRKKGGGNDKAESRWFLRR